MEGTEASRLHELSHGSESAETEAECMTDNMTSVDHIEDTQDAAESSASTSAQDSMTTKTSARSSVSDAPPPYPTEESRNSRLYSEFSVSQIDEHEAAVREKINKPLDEGQKGVIVSTKWLSRVLSRSSNGLNNNEYPKEAREGLIGPVDNSDIVPEGAFDDPILNDMEGKKFIPLIPGLVNGSDFECFNDEAWGYVVGLYGMVPGQRQISRYVHNSAPEAVIPNYVYETYPPVFTVRKVPQPTNDEDRPQSSTLAVQALRVKAEQAGRGQSSPDDALRLVSSRHERFQRFLARSKEAASIPRNTKVRVFKLLEPSKIAVEKPDNRQGGILSPPESRGASPSKAYNSDGTKLVLDLSTFSKMEPGRDLEPLPVKDESGNSNYNGNSTMDTFALFEDQTLVLEEQIGGPGGGDFASDKQGLASRFSMSTKSGDSRPDSATASRRTSPTPTNGVMTRGRQRRDGRTRGTIGLTNLGNTCYMNSALQCIRSVEELALYFLSNTYKEEINMSNPLGHKGAMAGRYAEVVKSIYADSASSAYTPSAFKKTLGNIQPLFSGYGQQDSQEFLSFLVDALHEDLNRVLKKPYNENPDSDDKTVHDRQAITELGEVYRANHKARNDSIAMDLFSGFYKNTMECPVCDKISITFDPYSLLTVQLPIENTFQHVITFVPLDGRPVNHMLDMDKSSTIKQVKQNMASKHTGVDSERLWMVEVYNHKLYKIFENSSTLAEASIQGSDHIFVFELEASPSNQPAKEKKTYVSSYAFNGRDEDSAPDMDDPKADQFAIPIFSRKPARYSTNFDAMLHPLYIVLTRKEAQDFEIILKKILIAVSRVTDRAILTEFDTDSRDIAPTDGKAAKRESGTEDSAHVSDQSSPSEDGYVEVSLHQAKGNAASRTRADGASAHTESHHDRPIPKNFMSPDYTIPSGLRNGLFVVNYAQGDGAHCTGMSSIQERTVRQMFSRVRPTARRASIQSSSSDERSTTSTGSELLVNDISEEDEMDNHDEPDIVLGGTSILYGDQVNVVNGGSDKELPANPLNDLRSRKGRRKQNKPGRKERRNKPKMSGRQGGRLEQHGRPGSASSRMSHNSADREDDGSYYIRLGEGIVLDWSQDAIEGLFGGGADLEDDLRGRFISSETGSGLPFVHDPDVEARKSRRETRKKHGITLDDCFNETGKREVLSEDNAWYCSRCKELRRATKTLEIWTIPDILVVHMKRFGGSRTLRDKIDVFVDYPVEGLDMSERVGLGEDGKEYVYDLFAVDCHFGGLGGGHYTAMAKNFYDGQWYDYNGES